MESVAKSIIKSDEDSVTEKNGSLRQSTEAKRRQSGRESFLEKMDSLKKSQEIVRKSQTSKVSGASKPVERNAIDMNVISDEEISDEVESKVDDKKKGGGRESPNKSVAFDLTAQKSEKAGFDQEKKMPMQMGKQPFGVAAERLQKEELLNEIKAIENIAAIL